MKYTEDEKKCVRIIARWFRENRRVVNRPEAIKEFGVDDDRYEVLIRMMEQWGVVDTVGSVLGKNGYAHHFRPSPYAEQLAREFDEEDERLNGDRGNDWQKDFIRFLTKDKGWSEIYFENENRKTMSIDLSIRDPKSKKLIGVIDFKESINRKIESMAKASLAQFADLELGRYLVTPSTGKSNYSFAIYKYSDKGLVRMQPNDFPAYENTYGDGSKDEFEGAYKGTLIGAFVRFLQEQKGYPERSVLISEVDEKDPEIIRGYITLVDPNNLYDADNEVRMLASIILSRAMTTKESSRLMQSSKDSTLEGKQARIKRYHVMPVDDDLSGNFNILVLKQKGGLEPITMEDFPTYDELISGDKKELDVEDKRLNEGLNNVPELPAFFKTKGAKINALRAILLEENKSVVIAGEPGIAKTTLANELVRDKEVQRHFKGWVIWFSFDADRDVIAAQTMVAQVMGQAFKEPRSVDNGRRLLKRILANKKVLIVLDNCQDIEEVKAFSGLGDDVKLIVTTRAENPDEMAQLIYGKVYRPSMFWGKPQNEPSEIGRGLYMNKRAEEAEICLNAHEYAEILEEVIVDGQKDEEGFCFALYGHWGRGKTFLMKLVEERLKKCNYETIFFSAWKYPTTPEVWIHLYETFVKRAYNFQSLKSIATTVRAGIVRKGLWPIVLQLWILAYFAWPKVSALRFVSDKVSLWAFLFLLFFLFRVKYSLSHLFRMYVTPRTYKEELGLQKAIGDDLTVLLRAWVAKDEATQPIRREKWLLFVSLLVLTFGLVLRLPKVFKAEGFWAYGITFVILGFIVLALCKLYSYVMRAGYWPEKVLLVIDDLDRCEVDKIADIIGSIKLFTEEDEIRKRVQVVVLVEEEVLKHALAEKYSDFISSREDSEDRNRYNRVINENIEKLFIGHLRLNELTSEEIDQVVSKITGRHVAIEGAQNRLAEDQKIEKTDMKKGKKTSGDSKESDDIKTTEKRRSNTLYSEEEHKIIREQVVKLYGCKHIAKLGPRAIRCFTMKYQIGRLICDKLKVPYTHEELAEAIVTCYYRKGSDKQSDTPLLDVARQVC
ncbi:MAG: hypothetical protein KAS75_04575 [Planctomycetes bacterium]|nr:hypothetical protein [Planctomycetota bacterium]